MVGRFKSCNEMGGVNVVLEMAPKKVQLNQSVFIQWNISFQSINPGIFHLEFGYQ